MKQKGDIKKMTRRIGKVKKLQLPVVHNELKRKAASVRSQIHENGELMQMILTMHDVLAHQMRSAFALSAAFFWFNAFVGYAAKSGPHKSR